MEMVIGGAFQGKAAFAEKMYPGISWVKGNEISREELFSARGVVGFHEFIKKEMEQGSSVEALAEEDVYKRQLQHRRTVFQIHTDRCDRSVRCRR